MYTNMSIPRGLTPAEERRLIPKQSISTPVTKLSLTPAEERRLIREKLNGHPLADVVLGLN